MNRNQVRDRKTAAVSQQAEGNFFDDREVYNINVLSEEVIPTPDEIRLQVPLTDETKARILKFRSVLKSILDGKDPRLVVVVGPCSIHDPDSAIEYAEKLQVLAKKVADTMFLVMRVYFEKPRTVSGWKGFINDPLLDDSFQIERGLLEARRLLFHIAELGLPAGIEVLDPLTPQYLQELVSWSAIGARTIESQTHREIASGLSTPVGFKNGTDGSIQVAINAMKAAARPQSFLGLTRSGKPAVYTTKGNNYGHLVLRGGTQPNYDEVSIELAAQMLRDASLPVRIFVDCSHGNTRKDFRLQPAVFRSCVKQIRDAHQMASPSPIRGLMLESNLVEGAQAFSPTPGEGQKNIEKLQRGVSITDPCIGWETTEELLLETNQLLS